MRITYSRELGQPFAVVEIAPKESFDFIVIALITPLLRISSPGGGPQDPAFSARSDNYVFHAPSRRIWDLFDNNMMDKYPSWYSQYVETDNMDSIDSIERVGGRDRLDDLFEPYGDDDPTDRGLTPPSRLNRARMAQLFGAGTVVKRTAISLFEPSAKQARRAISETIPARDIKHEGKERAI